jgi:hypothetical protein
VGGSAAFVLLSDGNEVLLHDVSRSLMIFILLPPHSFRT